MASSSSTTSRCTPRAWPPMRVAVAVFARPLPWPGQEVADTSVGSTAMNVAAPARPVSPREPSPAPRAAPRAADRAWDVAVVLVANGLIVAALWVRHGGLGTLHHPGGAFTAVGQLTGLYGTFALLVELLLMSRIGWIEGHIGFDRLAVWHRWTGFATVTLLSAHAYLDGACGPDAELRARRFSDTGPAEPLARRRRAQPDILFR